MAWPTAGTDGWGASGDIDPALSAYHPRLFALGTPHHADYFDPTPLGGAGSLLESEVRTVVGGSAAARARGSGIEVRLTQANVYGVTLLDSFQLLCGAPCSCLLTVYDEDRVTVLWEVSTSRTHPNPYLINPAKYQEQEIDVPAGAATLGTVAVSVIDPATVLGDQDTGWLTSRLALLGIPNIQGHRCRLVRFISSELGFQVVADGPAGAVTMNPDYASYTWEIRDTRESERRITAFETTVRALLPDEHLEGYGYSSFTDTYILDPAIPLKGHWYNTGTGRGEIAIGASEFPEQIRRLLIWQAAYDAIYAGLPRPFHFLHGDPDARPNAQGRFYLKWRSAGGVEPWTEIRETLNLSLSTVESTVTSGARVVGRVYVQDRRLSALPLGNPDYDPTAPALPAEDQIIEFMIVGPVAVDEQHPFTLETPDVSAGVGLLNSQGSPVLGRFNLVVSLGGYTSGLVDLTALPGNAEDLRRLRIAAYNTISNESTIEDVFIPSAGTLRWRAAGTTDPYQEITLEPAAPGGSSALVYIQTPFDPTYRIFTLLQMTAPDAVMPAHNQDIEIVLVRAEGTPDVGLTAGQFAINVYDGLYSERDPITGAVVPTGIRYDRDALLLLTRLIRVRITEPWKDVRDELEKKLYAPTGSFPSLDSIGRVSPLTQVPPLTLDGLDVLHNGNVEPSPEWDSGQRIINIITFTYYRDYNSGKPDPSFTWANDVDYRIGDVAIEAGQAYLCIVSHSSPQQPSTSPGFWTPTVERQNVVGQQEVAIRFENEHSIRKHGPHPIEIDGSLFRAVGRDPTVGEEPGTPPELVASRRPRDFERRQRQKGYLELNSQPVVRSAKLIIPASGDVEDEEGWQLAQERRFYLEPRYKLGAPAFSFNVIRSSVPLLRAGSWAAVDLSWLPDYTTGKRGLVALVQVIALGDLDCAWRWLLVEQVVPLAES